MTRRDVVQQRMREVVSEDIDAVFDVARPRTDDDAKNAERAEAYYAEHADAAAGNVARIAALSGAFDTHAGTALENPHDTQVITLTAATPPLQEAGADHTPKLAEGLRLLAENLSEIVVALDDDDFTIVNMNLCETRFTSDEVPRFVSRSLVPKLHAPIRPMLMGDFNVSEYTAEGPYLDALIDLSFSAAPLGLLPPARRFTDIVKRRSHRDMLSALLDGRSGVSYGFLAYAEPPRYDGPITVTEEAFASMRADTCGDDALRFDPRGRGYVRILRRGEVVCHQVPDIWILSSRSGANKTQLDPSVDVLRAGVVGCALQLQFPRGADRAGLKPSFDTLAQVALTMGAALYCPELVAEGAPIVHFHGYPSPSWFAEGEAFAGAANPSLPCGVLHSALLNYASMAQIADTTPSVELAVAVEPDHGVNAIGRSVSGLVDRLRAGVDSGQVRLGGEHLRALQDTPGGVGPCT